MAEETPQSVEQALVALDAERALSDEQQRNRHIIDSYLTASQAGEKSFEEVLAEMGVVEGDEVELDLDSLKDEDIVHSLLESSLVDMIREVNNGLFVLAETLERVKREGHPEVRAMSRSLWVLCIEEVSKVSERIRLLRTPPEGRSEAEWTVTWSDRHQGALELVDAFFEGLKGFDEGSSGRRKRALTELAVGFLEAIHRYLCSPEGEEGDEGRAAASAGFKLPVRRAQGGLTVHKPTVDR